MALTGLEREYNMTVKSVDSGLRLPGITFQLLLTSYVSLENLLNVFKPTL